ncbi:YdcF family protein [Paenibacillaceae bacterium WGS1546]|uniref:YdcF family protein n=1 Tax=Cohnella sp. WGS1546 TaxID=3366810 RepID=UPI00372CE90D
MAELTNMKAQLPRPRRSRIKWLWRLAAAGAAALAIWCASVYAAIVRFDPDEGELAPADVGIVLGARLWNDEPSPGLRERLDLALKLYREGLYDSFIVTGGLDAGGATITEAEGMRNYLVAQGVPEASIAMDTLSTSTYENLIFAQDLMEQNDWHTAIVVTHSYHGSRAANIAKKVGLEPVQVAVTESRVLNVPYHESREVLAYTKWLVTKAFL